jgi:hypothetical protein
MSSPRSPLFAATACEPEPAAAAGAEPPDSEIKSTAPSTVVCRGTTGATGGGPGGGPSGGCNGSGNSGGSGGHGHCGGHDGGPGGGGPGGGGGNLVVVHEASSSEP